MDSSESRDILLSAVTAADLHRIAGLAENYRNAVLAELTAAEPKNRERIFQGAVDVLKSAMRAVLVFRAHTSHELQQISSEISYNLRLVTPDSGIGVRFDIKA